jgi:hypothetical protein
VTAGRIRLRSQGCSPSDSGAKPCTGSHFSVLAKMKASA